MRTYDLKTLRELYRVDNKYWKTGDTDILPYRRELAKQVDEDFWSEISAMTSIATRTHKSVQDLVNALSALGFDVDVGVELDELKEWYRLGQKGKKNERSNQQTGGD